MNTKHIRHKFMCCLAISLAGIATSSAVTLIGPSTLNGSFEAEVAKQTTWDTVTAWANWDAAVGGTSTANNDSGTEAPNPPKPITDGVNLAFLQPGNAIYNLTSHILEEGDIISYQWDYLSAGRGDLVANLAYQDGSGNIVNIAGTDSFNPDNTSFYYDLGNNYTVQAGDAFIGQPLAITFDNNFGANNNWPEIDNVRLEVTVVPEPSSAALLGLGCLALVLRRRK